MEGKGTVRRLPSTPPASDTPAIRRSAPRNFSVMFMIVFLEFLSRTGVLDVARIARSLDLFKP